MDSFINLIIQHSGIVQPKVRITSVHVCELYEKKKKKPSIFFFFFFFVSESFLIESLIN